MRACRTLTPSAVYIDSAEVCACESVMVIVQSMSPSASLMSADHTPASGG